MEPHDPGDRNTPDLLTFTLGSLASIPFSYLGAYIAGSGPGGWGIHMLFVLPIVVMVGMFTSMLSVFLVLPISRSAPSRFLILALVNTIGSAFVSFGTMKILGA